MYNQIFNLINELVFNGALESASAEYLCTAGVSLAITLAVLVLPLVPVFMLFRLILDCLRVR